MESADLDSDFLTKFSCMGTTDKDVLINDLHSLLGSQLSREGCAFFLDMTNCEVWPALGLGLATQDLSVTCHTIHSLFPPSCTTAAVIRNIQAAVGAYYDFYYGTQAPEMVLVQDITIGNGESVPPHTEFSKCWRVKNSGSETWPPGVHLSLKSGDAMSGPSSISLPSLQPGEETSVTVQLVSPSAPGLYQSHWRACTMNGSVFGDVIWVIVAVEEGGVLGLTQQLSAISTQDSSHQMDSSTLPERTHHNPFGSPHSMLAEGSSSSPVLHHHGTEDSRTEPTSSHAGEVKTVSNVVASSTELSGSHLPANFTSGSSNMQSF